MQVHQIYIFHIIKLLINHNNYFSLSFMIKHLILHLLFHHYTLLLKKDHFMAIKIYFLWQYWVFYLKFLVIFLTFSNFIPRNPKIRREYHERKLFFIYIMFDKNKVHQQNAIFLVKINAFFKGIICLVFIFF